MKTSSPVLLYTLSLVLVSKAWLGSSNLTCVYDSVETVTCNWTQSQNATEAQCTLIGHVESQHQSSHFQGNPPQTCNLQGIGTTIRSCKLIFDEETYALTVTDSIRLVVPCHTGENERRESSYMKPFENLQLRPPHSVQMESDRKPSYNLTWQLHKVSHYLEGQLEYEVAYKKLGSPDKAATILPIMYDQQWIEIENLSPDSEYEAAVRVKVQDYSGFKSLWSRWSTPLKWRTHPKERPSLSLRPVLLGFGISSIFILLIAAVLVKTRIPKWLQKVLKFHLPDPVMFFPSLTAVHEGDVQKWLSSPSSMDSFHITATSPEVSVLEVLQKGSQDPCLLLPKDCLTPTEAPETSGHSLSSCFINHGYFFFHHHHSLEVEPCKVYFTYDPFAQENSSSEDDDSYQALHTAGDHPSLPSDSLVGIKEDVLLLPEMKEPTQKVHQTISPPSMERSPPVLATEQAETQKESEAIFPVSIYLYQSSTGTSNIHKQPASNVNEMEAVTDVASHISTEDNAASFLQPVIPYPGKASDVCQTTSCSQVPNSEAYLSLRELQSQYSHQSA